MAKNTTNSYRTTQDNKNALTKLHGSVSAGTEKAVESYIQLRPRIMIELKGFFTKAELSLIIDAYNGTIFDPRMAGNNNVLTASIEDAITFDNIAEKWEVEPPILFEKIAQLNATQTYFLLEEIDRFWNNKNAYGAPNPNLDIFLKEFSI